MTTYGLLIFDDVEELDFVGPWQVFTRSRDLRGQVDKVVLIAERPDLVRCNRGMRVLPDHTLDDHPPLDVLLVPGGQGARRREVNNPPAKDWIAQVASQADWVTSVCTGMLLLHAAGPARGRRVTTDWEYLDEARALGDVTVVGDARYVVDGNLVTSQGVSAGIDMALWLIGRLHGRDHARAVRRKLQYGGGRVRLPPSQTGIPPGQRLRSPRSSS